MADEASGPALEAMTLDECRQLLRDADVGRISVSVNGYPVILPVNYRFVETSGPTWVALRTRHGGLLEHVPAPTAFEIDAIHPEHHEGWSVLVRGTLQRVDPTAADFAEHFDPGPWPADDRDVWLVVEPFFISGRRLRQSDVASWAALPEDRL